MTPASIIAQLEATTKRTEKEAIVKAAWDAGVTEFFLGAKMAYSALITYGVKKAPLIEGEDEAGFKGTLTWDKFTDILGKLERRELTGNTARDVLRAAADASTVADWNGWYRRILLKDLKCGITEATVNKILDKAGDAAKPYIIPVFSCQLAKNGEDHPKKIAGKKYLDVKLDGCLSASWTVEFEDGKRVSIAEVVNNRLSGRVKSLNVKTGRVEYNNISNWAKNGSDINDSAIKWYQLTLENGKVLPPLTGNHMVWLPKLKCWRRVDLLTVGDILLQMGI
jgi:hypothetical protein